MINLPIEGILPTEGKSIDDKDLCRSMTPSPSQSEWSIKGQVLNLVIRM